MGCRTEPQWFPIGNESSAWERSHRTWPGAPRGPSDPCQETAVSFTAAVPICSPGFGVLHRDPPDAQGAQGVMLWVLVPSPLILILLCGTWVPSCGSPQFLGQRRGQGTKGTSFDTTWTQEVVWGCSTGFFFLPWVHQMSEQHFFWWKKDISVQGPGISAWPPQMSPGLGTRPHRISRLVPPEHFRSRFWTSPFPFLRP